MNEGQLEPNGRWTDSARGGTAVPRRTDSTDTATTPHIIAWTAGRSSRTCLATLLTQEKRQRHDDIAM